jgi:hypothetical protein
VVGVGACGSEVVFMLFLQIRNLLKQSSVAFVAEVGKYFQQL